MGAGEVVVGHVGQRLAHVGALAGMAPHVAVLAAHALLVVGAFLPFEVGGS